MGLVRILVAAIACMLCAVVVGVSVARPARSDTVTISMLANSQQQPGYAVLIPNFERVYPNIVVNITYVATAPALYQLETTELAAGNAPDLLATYPGCGTPVSTCELAKSGDLAPMVKAPWVKRSRSLPLVTSLSKYDQGLYAFEPAVSPEGIFTNNALFYKLGLGIPQTFSQLLNVCQQAKAAGSAAIVLPGASEPSVQFLITDLAIANVYGTDKQWARQLKAGTVTFDGTAGWQEALQEFIDMNNAGCFEPGATGTSLASAETLFAQGQGLMMPGLSSFEGSIEAANPGFTYSFDPFPSGTEPNQLSNFLQLPFSVSVNAHSSSQNQAAAQTFVNFIARPGQVALYARETGGLTQYEFLKGQIPSFMSSFATVFKHDDYIIDPIQSWWNPNVLLALQTDGIGLITGQETINDVLDAMDAAWQQGPS